MLDGHRLVGAASLVPALLNAFTSYLNSRFSGRGSVDWGAVIFAGALWLFFGALAPIPYILAWRYPLKREAIVHTISAHVAGELVLSVRDNGPGYVAASDAGVGLVNTRARLETLFGAAGRLDVLNAEGGGTIATLRLPLRRRADG
jgi:hypothetical protein